MDPTTPTASKKLTKRERQVADLIAKGMTNKQIAKTLNMATLTAKTHVHNVMEKLGYRSRIICALALVHQSYLPKPDYDYKLGD